MNAMHVTNLTPIQNIPNAQPETDQEHEPL